MRTVRYGTRPCPNCGDRITKNALGYAAHLRHCQGRDGAAYLDAAQREMARRGLSGVIDETDRKAIRASRAAGRTAVEAGAIRAMHILRTT